MKFKVFTPLQPEEVLVEGDLVAQVPFLKMEYCDLGDHAMFPQLEPSIFLKSVYYEEASIMMLEPMK